MAIPVDKAPAPYVPPPRRPEQPLPGRYDGSLDDLRRPQGPEPRGPQALQGPNIRRVQVRLGRGCSLAFLLGVLSACIISGFGVWMLVQFASRDYDARALRITESIREAAREQGRESAFDADLRHFDELAVAHRISIVATAALVRRHGIAKQDGELDEAEVDHMMEVVHDVSIHDGEVDPARYPEAGEMP